MTHETSQAYWRTSRPPQSWEPIQINEEHHERCSINTAYKIKTKALINMIFFICVEEYLIYLYNKYQYFTMSGSIFFKIAEKLYFYEQTVLKYTNNLQYCFACPPEALDWAPRTDQYTWPFWPWNHPIRLVDYVCKHWPKQKYVMLMFNVW